MENRGSNILWIQDLRGVFNGVSDGLQTSGVLRLVVIQQFSGHIAWLDGAHSDHPHHFRSHGLSQSLYAEL